MIISRSISPKTKSAHLKFGDNMIQALLVEHEWADKKVPGRLSMGKTVP
jgi:hypothetical protein